MKDVLSFHHHRCQLNCCNRAFEELHVWILLFSSLISFCLFFPFLYAIIHGGRVTHCLILRSWVTSNCLEKCSYIEGVIIEDVLGKAHRRAVRHAQYLHRLLLGCLVSLDLICMIKVIAFPYKRLINVNVNVNVKKCFFFFVLALWLKFIFIKGCKIFYIFIFIWCLFYKYIFSFCYGQWNESITLRCRSPIQRYHKQERPRTGQELKQGVCAFTTGTTSLFWVRIVQRARLGGHMRISFRVHDVVCCMMIEDWTYLRSIFSIFVMNSEAWQWSLNEYNSTFS